MPQRQMIVQMAKNYDPNNYGARINMEHIRGYDLTGLAVTGDPAGVGCEMLAGRKGKGSTRWPSANRIRS